MKKLIILAMICLFTLTGCGGGEIEVEPFSYEEYMSNYGSPDVGIRDDFKHTTKKKIRNAEDAIEIAKDEIIVDYNTIHVSYDETADIWRVTFYTVSDDKNIVIFGGGQDVYLNGDGITQRVIFTE